MTIVNVAILTVALGLASLINYFIIGAITSSIVESKKNEDEPKPFPYNVMSIANAASWLLLSTCFSFLGILIWKSMHPTQQEARFIYSTKRFLVDTFQSPSVYPMFLAIASAVFIFLGASITEKPTEFPATLDTSIKMSFVVPHHKLPNTNGNSTPKEVKQFQLINLIMLAASTCMPLVLAVSSST